MITDSTQAEDYSLMKMALRSILRIPYIKTAPSPGPSNIFSFLVGLTAAKIPAGENMINEEINCVMGILNILTLGTETTSRMMPSNIWTN